MPLPLPSTVFVEVASVASGVEQVVSPGPKTSNVTAPVAPTAPLRVATSLIVPPTVTGPEACVVIDGVTWVVR